MAMRNGVNLQQNIYLGLTLRMIWLSLDDTFAAKYLLGMGGPYGQTRFTPHTICPGNYDKLGQIL